MKDYISILGFSRVQPNLTTQTDDVIFLRLIGNPDMGSLNQSSLEMEDNVVLDYDGQPSAGQDVYLTLTAEGKVKVSRETPVENSPEIVCCEDLGPEANNAIREFALSPSGGILKITGGKDGLRVSIDKRGKGNYTKALITQVNTKGLSVFRHIIWQFVESEGKIICNAFIPSSIARIQNFGERLFDPKYFTVTPNVFFKEFVGEDYKKGLGGYRVLILGESLFCDKDGKGDHERCPFFQHCTDLARKNSSPFEEKCPFNSTDRLSDAVKYNVESFLKGTAEGEIKSYQTFTQLMCDIGVVRDAEELFSRVVFYDYLQFYSPERSIDPSYLSDRDDQAFEEIIKKYDPSVIIIWGTTVANRIKKGGKYPPRNIRGDYDINYIFNQKIAGKWRTFFSMYHPSDSHGYLSKTWNEHVSHGRLIFNP